MSSYLRLIHFHRDLSISTADLRLQRTGQLRLSPRRLTLKAGKRTADD